MSVSPQINILPHDWTGCHFYQQPSSEMRAEAANAQHSSSVQGDVSGKNPQTAGKTLTDAAGINMASDKV